MSKRRQDPDDEVRRLAFAMLDRRDAEIQRRIQQATQKLTEREPSATASLHQALAENYMELAASGLATGVFRGRALEMAETHCRQAIETSESATRYLLLSEILLAARKVADCKLALVGALRLGAPYSAVAPTMAEASFEERRFDQVAECLRSLNEGGGGLQMDGIRRFWTREAAQ